MSERNPDSICIVTPVYNEEDCIEAFYDSVCTRLRELGMDYHIIFVDDGSRDNTLLLLNRLANQDPAVTVLSLARNFGHQIALTAGLDFAEADLIVTMDSDLQHPPETIAEMVEAYRGGAEVVYGVRRNDDTRGIGKQVGARLFYSLMGKITKVNLLAGAVDFRLMSRDVVAALRSMREVHRYLRGMVPWLGFPYEIVYYDQQERFAGEAKYNWRQLAQLARHGLFSFSTFPLDIITWLGASLTVLAGLYLVLILFTAVLKNVPSFLPGWTSIIAAMLLLSGVQLISLGVIAQYIGMIFEQVKSRPLYTLKQQRLGLGIEKEKQA